MERTRHLTTSYLTGARRVPGRGWLFFGHYYRSLGGLASRIVRLDGGQWSAYCDLPELVHGISIGTRPAAELMTLTRAGIITRPEDPAQCDVGVRTPEVDPASRGLVMDMRQIGEHHYICGLRGQVRRRVGNTWEPVGGGLVSYPTAHGGLLLLNGLGGLSESNLYAVGQRGCVFHWNGSKWAELESPTERALSRVLPVDADNAFICGDDGALYVGGRGGWKDLGGHLPGVTYRDMACFDGRLYLVSDACRLYVADDDGGPPREVIPDGIGACTFVGLAVGDGALWSVGDDAALRFDGRAWTRYRCPEDLLRSGDTVTDVIEPVGDPTLGAGQNATMADVVELASWQGRTHTPLHGPRREHV